MEREEGPGWRPGPGRGLDALTTEVRGAEPSEGKAAVIPRRDAAAPEYDLIIAAQPYRCRQQAERKVRFVLEPLARRLAPGGRMVTIQSTGQDPGMEIIRRVWPGEEPFPGSGRRISRVSG